MATGNGYGPEMPAHLLGPEQGPPAPSLADPKGDAVRDMLPASDLIAKKRRQSMAAALLRSGQIGGLVGNNPGALLGNGFLGALGILQANGQLPSGGGLGGGLAGLFGSGKPMPAAAPQSAPAVNTVEGGYNRPTIVSGSG